MEQSANLQIPYIMPSQAQKHVTHNEAIRTLDALVQLSVVDRDLFTPPGSPGEGDRYLVATGGTGAWAGKDGRVAAWQDGAWAFLAPKAGWLLWVADETRLLGFDGSAWIDAAVHSVNPAPLVGVNATADTTNRLAVKSPASLFDEEAGDHRLKINKAAADDTASLVFQSGYSGRAEFGLAGDDDWHVKVSADGTVWTEALKVDRTTGRVSLPAALPLGDDNQVVARRHVREKLAANRTYYVRMDGSDGNDGLADTSGGAFLTIQKAIDVALALDMSIYSVTIAIGAGSFSENLTIAGNGNARITLDGDGYSVTTVGVAGSGGCINVSGACSVTIRDMTIASGNAVSVWVRFGAVVSFMGSIQLNGATVRMIAVDSGASVTCNGSTFYLAGSSPVFFYAVQYGSVVVGGGVSVITTIPITVTNTIFCRTGYVSLNAAMVWSESAGAITGSKYNVSFNGVIISNGTTIAGSAAGGSSTGGQYA